MIGRRIEVFADLARVRAFCEGQVVAGQELAWARHQTLSTAEHVAVARALRAARVGLLRPGPVAEQGRWRLSDYDAALGLTDGGVA